MNSPQPSDKYILLWDLHEVILQKRMTNWFKICLHFNKKWSLLWHLNWHCISLVIRFILERLKITKTQMVSEELINEAKKTGNTALIELAIKICCAYSLIQNTDKLMHELSLLGYTHHLCSNIGETVYRECLEKFPHVFNQFSGYTIPFMMDGTIIKKPNPLFFLAHAEKYGIQPDQFIFIDDRLTNVEAAQQIGMNALLFTDAHQLRNDLKKFIPEL